MNEADPSLRAELYRALAETLAEPAEWLALPGAAWPLTAAAGALAPCSPAAAAAYADLRRIPAESHAQRRRRYVALFHRAQPGAFALYEAQHRDGRLLTGTTWQVGRLYRAAGLRVEGAELPDHAAPELAFLAYLADRQAAEPQRARGWRRLERAFLRRHAGQWLPDVGRALGATGDPVFGPIGRLLAGWLAEAINPVSAQRQNEETPLLPVLSAESDCTLCGFCVQVCPTRALVVEETARETRLVLVAAACTGCRKCEPVCTPGVMRVEPAVADPALRQLRASPRLACPGCQQPTVSLAEFEFVTSQIGDAPWLAYCPACRSGAME